MELIESCKRAIAENRCLGCQALENLSYAGNPNCEYSKVPSSKESIRNIKETLGIQEKLEI